MTNDHRIHEVRFVDIPQQISAQNIEHSRMICVHKFIDIGHGLQALVDADDYDHLMKYKWHPAFSKDSQVCYAKTSKHVNGKVKCIRMHRLITNAPKGLVVDHINHNTLDNRKENLRVVTQHENLKNITKPINNSSGICGVNLLKRKKGDVWVADITVNRKNIYLGTFRSKEEAVLARLAANKKYGFHENHGQY